MPERCVIPITVKRIIGWILVMVGLELALVAFMVVDLYWPDARFLLTVGKTRAEVVQEYGQPTSEGEKEIIYATVLHVITLRLSESGRVRAVQIVLQD